MGRFAAYAVAATALLAACCAEQESFMSAVSPREWSQAVQVVYPNADTLSRRSISVVVRYNNNFRADTLPLRMTVSPPGAGADDARFTERVEFLPQCPRTKPGIATVECFAYRRHSVLPQSGGYTFTIEPCTPLKGVEAIGINIEKEQ